MFFSLVALVIASPVSTAAPGLNGMSYLAFPDPILLPEINSMSSNLISSYATALLHIITFL